MSAEWDVILEFLKANGLELSAFVKHKAIIVNDCARIDEDGEIYYTARRDVAGNTLERFSSCFDAPKTEGEILTAMFAVATIEELHVLLGDLCKDTENPPNFIKTKRGRGRDEIDYSAGKAIITENIDKSLSISLPINFVKGDTVNKEILTKVDDDTISIALVQTGTDGEKDVIGYAIVSYKLLIDLDTFQTKIALFIDFLGMKNTQTFGRPTGSNFVSGTQFWWILENCFKRIRFKLSNVNFKSSAYNLKALFNIPSENGEPVAITEEAVGYAVDNAMTFWTKNGFIQMSKQDANDKGLPDDDELEYLNPISKSLTNQAAVATVAAVAAPVTTEEDKHADNNGFSYTVPRSQGVFIDSKKPLIDIPDQSSELLVRVPSEEYTAILTQNRSRRSSAASSLASNAGGGGSLAQNSMFQIQPRVNNPISRVGRLAQGVANATPYNPFGAGGGGAMRFEHQSRKPEYLMPDDVTRQQIENELTNLNNLFGNREKTPENQASNNPIEQDKKEAIVEDSGVLTYDSDEEVRLSKFQQGMAKQSRDLGPSFSNSIPSAGMAKASNTFANSNVSSNQSKPPSSNVQPYYEKFAMPFQKEMFKQHLAYADMLDNKSIKKNDDKIDDEVVRNPNIVVHNVTKEIKDYEKAEREKNLSRPRDFDDPPNRRQRSRHGGRKTKRRQKTNKRVTKKRNPMQRRTLRVTKKRNTRQTKRRHK